MPQRKKRDDSPGEGEDAAGEHQRQRDLGDLEEPSGNGPNKAQG